MKQAIITILLFSLVSFYPNQGYSKIKKKNLFKVVEALTADSLGGRAAGSGNDLKAAQYIEKQLLNMGYEPMYGECGITEFEYRVQKGYLKSYNVVMILKPKKQTSKYILMGAHHDHLGIRDVNGQKVIYPGANDNASGVASLLEVARNIRNKKNKLNHNIIIAAFGAEEIGLIGSRELAKTFISDSLQLAFMLNIEMTGCLDAERNVDVLGSDTFNLEGALKNLNNPDNLKFNPLKAATYGSDHLWFAQTCPVAVFATNGSKHYHKPEDTITNINFSGMTLLTKYIYNFIGGVL